MPLSKVWALTSRYPRLLLAVKTAVASGIAWLLVQPLGGFVDDYPYYAPLGAVVAMSTSVVASVRSGAQAVAAIVAGAMLAVAVHALPVTEPVAIGVGIGLGMLLAAARPFGEMGSWVPFATLFVLIIGAHDPWRYAAAYGGLVGLGAVVGIVVNLVWPQLPLTPATLAQERLRRRLADQLDLLADGLERAEVLSPEDWAELQLELRSELRRVEDLVAAAVESRRVNWRAAQWAETAERSEAQARALKRLTGCVDVLIALVGDARTSVHASDELGQRLREAAVSAFRAVAEMLRTVPRDRPRPEVAAADEAVTRLKDEAARATAQAGHPYLAAGALAVSLDQAVEAWS